MLLTLQICSSTVGIDEYYELLFDWWSFFHGFVRRLDDTLPQSLTSNFVHLCRAT